MGEVVRVDMRHSGYGEISQGSKELYGRAHVLELFQGHQAMHVVQSVEGIGRNVHRGAIACVLHGVRFIGNLGV